MSLQALLGEYTCIDKAIGRVGDTISRCRADDGSIVFIKDGQDGIKSELQREFQILSLIQGNQLKITTPRVHNYSEEDNRAVLILSEFPGEESQRLKSKISRKKIVEMLAKAIKELHTVNVASLNPAPPKTFDYLIDEIKGFIKTKTLNETEFTEEAGMHPIDALDYLIKNRSICNEDTFIHGDFCLPNMLLSEDSQYGIIDWALGGIGDKDYDLTGAEKSIKRNFGEEFIKEFSHAYGYIVNGINPEKRTYFDILRQFSYSHYKNK